MELAGRLREAQAFVESRGYTCAYLAVYGSQNYGLELDMPDYRSDLDVKCVVMPGLSILVRGESVPPVTLDWQGGQIEIKDARRYTEVCARLNPAYLETLLTPHYLAPCAAFERIRGLTAPLLAQAPAGFLQACRGVAMVKMKNLSHPFPAAMEKIRRWGYDGKQAHHMYRLLLVMRHFEKTRAYALMAPREEYDFLIALKRNELPLEQARMLTAQWAQEMEEICRCAAGNGDGFQMIVQQMQGAAFEAVEESIRNRILSAPDLTGRSG